jgi:hypothetical protein
MWTFVVEQLYNYTTKNPNGWKTVLALKKDQLGAMSQIPPAN